MRAALLSVIGIVWCLAGGSFALAAEESAKEPGEEVIALADVTISARPTGKRHQSYLFTLASKQGEERWVFELYQDFGGGILLQLAGNQTTIDKPQELQSWHHQATRLKLSVIPAGKTIAGQTLTHELLSITYGVGAEENPADLNRRP